MGVLGRILGRMLAGAVLELAVGIAAAMVIGVVGGVAAMIVFALNAPPRPPDDPGGLPLLLGVLAGISMAISIGIPVGPMVGAIVCPLARFRIYSSINVGVVADILAGLVAAFTLGRFISFPEWTEGSTVLSEILAYSAIGGGVGSVAGVLVGNIGRIPLSGAGTKFAPPGQ